MGSDGNDWVQVTRKGKRRAAPIIPDVLRPNPNPELSVNDILKYHNSLLRNTQTIDWWKRLGPALDDASRKPGSLPLITKAVCLGTGPYDPENGSITARRTAHMQTATFRHIVHHLESLSGQRIKCYIQEPRFTQVDKKFCSELELEAVDSPEGFSLVDGETLLFGIHMELEIYNQALAGQLPAVYVGSSLQEWENILGSESESDTQLTAFCEMDAKYHKYELPDFEYMFSSTVMYWRKG
ncbi:hypothetical protein VTJ49DRAFT_771 [Mycothermus thermophilus]|uniref:SRR1-like domain-containing protein n=1 Tax=Humicola insolens TaxID=85995 RepID=A0ABR3VER6_HUMIN